MVPEEFEAELLELGLDTRNQRMVQRDAKWEGVYMPGLREYHAVHGHINIPQTHAVLGRTVNQLRMGMIVPPQFEQELVALGLDTRNQFTVKRETTWSSTFMPAFRAHYETHGHANAPQSHPVLGKLVVRIRLGIAVVPADCMAELQTMGLFLCAKSLARHVARVLGHPVTEADPKARAVVARAAAEHARLLALRAELRGREAKLRAGLFTVPLGTQPLGDGMARFTKDLRRLEV
jgi:hypothetical protein